MTSRPDFPDWISPMLVKELRQGMRSRVFLLSFLALQAAMIVLIAVGLLDTSMGNETGGFTFFFWLIVGLPLLMIMPLSGLNSISGEKKENTLELIFLSRLGARRIVAGKWLAIVAQTALLVSAILPYAVLRYYLGGIDLVANLEVLGWLLLGSATLTGITVAVSPSTGRFAKAFVPVVVLFGIQLIGIVQDTGLAGPIVGGPSGVVKALGGIFLLALLFLYFLLEVGAGNIAPAAENHSSSKRLAALGVLLVCGLYSIFVPGSSWLWLPASLVLVPVGIGAICEPIREVPSVYRPFVRRGAPGRLLGLLFYPGWPSGFFFSLVVLAILFLTPHGPFAKPFGPEGSVPPFVAVCIVGGFFLPAAVFHLFRLRFLPPLVFYVLFQAACALLVVLVRSLSANDYPGNASLLAMMPFCGLLMAPWMQQSWHPLLILFAAKGAAVITLFSLVVLFLRMIPCWKKIFALEKAAAAIALPPSVPHVAPSSEPA